MPQPLREDDEEGLIDDLQWEAMRQRSLRVFIVRLEDGSHETVFAHFHDSANNPQGHLGFTTVQESGRKTISALYHYDDWRRVTEIRDPQADRKLRSMDEQNAATNPVGMRRGVH